MTDYIKKDIYKNNFNITYNLFIIIDHESFHIF